MQISDDLMLGPVASQSAGANSAGPSLMEKGVGPMGRVFVFDSVPLALNLTGVAAAQAVAGASNLTLTAGTRLTSTTDLNGATVIATDVPRCIDAVSSGAGDTTQTILITGYDQYWQPMTQLITLNGTTRVATLKAFKYIKSAAISAAAAGNISLGTTDVLGLPYRLLSKDYINFNYNATLGLLAAVTAAVLTSPSTNLIGDVRGTIALASVSDGAKRLVATMAMPAIACGPNATATGVYGVAQV